MSPLFSRRVLRKAPLLRALLIVSLAVSTFILLLTKARTGVYLGCLTDHFHHARATWNFFDLGFDVYKVTQDEACARVPYPHDPRYGCTWGTWPVAYPPGVIAVFAPPALLGRIAALSELELGKAIIAYLLIITHAAVLGFAALARRVGSAFWMGVVAFVWIFLVRLALLGLYEGAWILAAVLAVDAMRRSRPARALLWFSVTALVCYRSVCLAPIAAVALWQLRKTSESRRASVLALVVSAVTVAVVFACARALVRYGPGDLAHSSFVPFAAYSWLLLGVGLAVAIAAACGSSLLVGVTVAFSSVLSLYHPSHNWHATLCIAPLLALVLARRRPLWTQVLVGVWFVFYLQYVFQFPPLLWAEEIIRFLERGGRPGCLLPFES